MQPFNTKAIVLRRTNYGEADRILSILTPERGKVSAIAKGVRKPKSKLAGGLELLALCDVTLLAGRGNMARITSARLDTFYGAILQDYDRLTFAYSAIKRINKATETISEPEFFDLLLGTLECLNNPLIDRRITELWFALQLDILLGHGINLATDREGNALEADKMYQYDFDDQAFFEHAGGKFGAAQIKLLRLAAVKSPVVLRQVSGVDEALDECLWLINTAGG